MDTVGAYFKRERELRGFTLEEISRATRINIRYLKALEADDYQALPAEAFVKGFLRSYAQCIGLSPQDAMLVYEQCKGPDESAEGELSVDQPGEGKDKRRPSRKLMAAGVLLAAFLIVLAFMAVRLLDTKEKQQRSDAMVNGAINAEHQTVPAEGELKEVQRSTERDRSEKISSPSTATSEKGLSPKLTILPMRMSPQAGWSGDSAQPPMRMLRSASFSGPGEGKLILRIRALTGSWVEVRVDELDRDERLFLPRGDTRVWTANDRILLTLGNTSGVELELNGKKISIPETEGNVLRNYALTRDSLP